MVFPADAPSASNPGEFLGETLALALCKWIRLDRAPLAVLPCAQLHRTHRIGRADPRGDHPALQ